MKNKIVIVLFLTLSVFSSIAQMAKCKGKYFGNIIGTSVPANYNTLWNAVTPENGTKWGVVERTKGVYNWDTADVIYNYAKKNGILFKFHTLVWGSQMPDWVPTATKSQLTQSVQNYIKAAADHFNPMGGLAMIDVLNEPANPVLPDYMIAALTAGYKAEPANANDLNNPYGWAIWPYQLARKYFPNSILLTNEYNIEENWQGMKAPYITIINAIKNAPNITDGKKNLLDGFGLECHGVHLLTAANFKAVLDEMWNSTGLPIHITEFNQWADPDEAKQKTVYETLIPIAWEHPHVAGITLWGYVQGSTWRTGNGIIGPKGTDTGIQYPSTYTSSPSGDRPALIWLKQYMASQSNLVCCPAPAPFARCFYPNITITSPVEFNLYASTASIPLSVSASDVDGTVSSVAYYNGTTLIATLTTSPFSFTWKNVTAGTYTIYAIATDNNGFKTTSNNITFTVAKPVNHFYQCISCTNPIWTETANWTPTTIPSVIDTAIIKLGEVKVSTDIKSIIKVEPNGIFRLLDSVNIADLRLQGGILKSYTSTPMFILTSTINVEKASTIMVGSVPASVLRIDGTITGSGNLTKTGVAVLQVNANASTFKGTWIVNSGKLKLRSATGLGLCGVEVDSSANLDVETTSSTNALVLNKNGTVNLDANLTVQVAVFDNINIPAGIYTASSYPTFISGVGTLTVLKDLVVISSTAIGSITLTANSGLIYSWSSASIKVATTSAYTTTVAGTYSVSVTNSNGCNVNSAIIGVQLISLKKGWNLISTNIRPSDSTISTMFYGLNVLEVKTMDEFWSANQKTIFNSIKTITPGNGYLVNMNAIGKLMIAGYVETRLITFLPIKGWQLIGCPFQIATALSNYFNTTNCLLLKNFDGFWIPNGTTNSFVNLEAGKGYFLKK